MACYQPIRAFQRDRGGPVKLLPARGPRGEPSNLELPCGKCLGCQQTRANHWAERCKHEAQQHQHCSFLTLTYNDRWAPNDGNLQPRDLQLFLKRLRKRLHRVLASDTKRARPQSQRVSSSDPRNRILSNPRAPLRYFACGEYGEETGRPHYHLLLFNADFAGARIGTSHGHELRTNDHLADCWSHPTTNESYGHHTIGTALPGAVAGYIAKYVLKSHRYNSLNNPICDRDGVANPLWIKPPFTRMSKGIGLAWLTTYHSDLAKGYITSDGRKVALPRYYKRQLTQKERFRQTALALEHYQHQYQQFHKGDSNTPERRKDAQLIHEQKHSQQTRR